MDEARRSLHWVLKIGNLKESMRFYEGVLGLRVLRHEEFDSGCEATCNGPYAGAWSKTMIGHGPERENFALELTYNYGIDGYDFGNDLQYIALQGDVQDFSNKAKSLGYKVEEAEGGAMLIHGPDKYKYKIVPPIPGRTEAFLAVALRVDSLDRALSYWRDLLGLREVDTFAGMQTKDPSVTVAFAANHTALQLIEVKDGQRVDHAKSSGRIAFACKSVQPVFEAVKGSGDTVQTPPLTLPTPGKADVVVTILVDRDGYEICFVEDEAFYDLATPTYDAIDWEGRRARGGDGAPPPSRSSKPVEGAEGKGVAQVEDKAGLQKALDDAKGQLVVADFGAGWCKNCKKVEPLLHNLAKRHAGALTVVGVDVDNAEELTDEYNVSSVPRLLFFKDGKKVDDYLGSDMSAITNKIEGHLPTSAGAAQAPDS